MARRLQGAFSQGFTESGSPEIKPQDERHHCRHKYRVVFRERVVFLTLSRHRQHWARRLSYPFVPGTLAPVLAMARLFQA